MCCLHLRSGVQIKTRKRNIAVALDPGSFADAVVTIFEDARDGDSLEKNLASGVKVLEATQLDFSRYGDTLFEVFFAGGRLAAGGNVVEEGKKLSTNVRPPPCITHCAHAQGAGAVSCMCVAHGSMGELSARAGCVCVPIIWTVCRDCATYLEQVLAAEATKEAVMPYLKMFQTLLRCALECSDCMRFIPPLCWQSATGRFLLLAHAESFVLMGPTPLLIRATAYTG